VPGSLASFIRDIPVIDVHEHHMTEPLLNRDVGLARLLRESYAGWTQKRPSLLSVGGAGADAPAGGGWAEIAPYFEGSGTNAFVRNIVRALQSLHGLKGPSVTERNWAALDSRIRERHADPGWNASVMERAGIVLAVTDQYTDPLADATAALGERYRSVLRINAFAMGWHAESRDHNSNSALEMLGRLGMQPRSFEEYLETFPRVLDLLPGLHKVGLKNALAYDRSVNFDDIDHDAARNAWGKKEPAPAEKKAFGDVVIDAWCRLAGERDIPVQMHLGTGRIRGSRPLEAAGLIERNPRTRFLLMHLAYPWTDELLGMAFVYRNIWLDLTWSWLLSPNRFPDSLREAVDVLPDESRMMIGGDAWHVEETYAAITIARELVGETLDSCVRAGQFSSPQAERLARKILHDNASEFFRLRT
jgi:uncharacterized protein